ncbi:hypothetical protein [Methylobacterium aerolatum]|uniref:Glycosyl transferase family 1 domain-containing protein n=1 Tax=Methylobacterium aerolatum TaxID=418708 RepID=A0ABU0I5Z3_9HYPH|nr:hypothetical protein [Methylobacterium aerolatum]MDQ0450038.1 hypothetical protein [Methylobacterium aerolatum]GJD37372.1 hypothetical protein FMGBMHLM_4302 [Methylobacterium aerolatum]
MVRGYLARKVLKSFKSSSAKQRSFASDVYAEAKKLFDPIFYLEHNPDVANSKFDPFEHYIEYGWRENRNPNADFSTSFYLSTHPDVAASGQCPLLHYVRYGLAEQRVVAGAHYTEDRLRDIGQKAPTIIPSYLAAELRASFDESYYVRQISETIIGDPLQHYLDFGWRKGARPTQKFDAMDYLEFNPDVKTSGIHPFIHYVGAGKKEQRICLNDLKPIRNAILNATTAEKKSENWRKNGNIAAIGADALFHKLNRQMPSVRFGLVVSMSHDNYLESTGGIQIYLADEQAAFNFVGWCHLHISPVHPLPGFSSETDPQKFLIQVNLNGKSVGVTNIDSLAIAVRNIRPTYADGVKYIIHSLIGTNPEIASSFADTSGVGDVFFFVHDFSALCSNFTLLRNDGEFCNAPAINSNSCDTCVYREERRYYLARFENYFNTFKPTMVFPSQIASKFWNQHSPFSYRTENVVCEHASLIELGQNKNNFGSAEAKEQPLRLRIAFVGAPVRHKGWNEFERLVLDAKTLELADFYLFSRELPVYMPQCIRHVPVNVSGDDRSAMVTALKSESIDIVFMWSLCFETFSFVTLEAIAAGCFVLGRAASGNVGHFIKRYNSGRAFDTMDDLFEYISGAEIMTDIANHKAQKPNEFCIQPSDKVAKVVVG